MARGGAREGAGRKVGSATKKTREIAEKAVAEGITPLEFMLNRMRDDGAPMEDRMDMAKAAAPYIHAKLAAVQHSGDADNPVAYQIMSGVTRQDDPTNDDDQAHATH